MTDNLTKEQRSFCMSRIRSKWTLPEKRIHNFLKGHKIKHEMHPKIAGSPDIILKDKRIAIFIHGCFWHKCPRCFNKPRTKIEYWRPKLEKNAKRDKLSIKMLRNDGWRVIRLWEHEIKSDFEVVLKKIINT